jgi:hypothetical protein
VIEIVSMNDYRQRTGWLAMAILLAVSPLARAITFDELLDSYDVLETVAGTALVTDVGVNGWEPAMEGGLAIAAELSRPHVAMSDWNGNVYIADKDAHAIRMVTPSGQIVTVAGTNARGYNGDGVGTEVELSEPNGLFTFPNGVTYILDLGNSMVRRLSLDGEITTVFEDPYGMVVGRGLWVSPDEETIVYASGTEVREWTEDEGVTVLADGFLGLGNITVDPSDGNVVVTDREGHGVYKLFADGSRQRIAGNETTSGGGNGFPAISTGLEEVRGIEYHPGGGYLLATHHGGQVWFVDTAGIIHLLVDGDDDNDTHAGDGLPLSAPGRKLSEPRAVTLSPNGDLLITEHDGGYIRRARSLEPWLMGDFDHDHELGESDIDVLTVAARDGSHPQTLDLTFDGLINDLDRQTWIRDLRQTYVGDANLDGVFNSSDLVAVLASGSYEADVGSVWSTGDFNGDGRTNSSDLVAALADGGYEAGPRLAATPVPEPHESTLLWSMCVIGRHLVRRRRRPTASSIGQTCPARDGTSVGSRAWLPRRFIGHALAICGQLAHKTPHGICHGGDSARQFAKNLLQNYMPTSHDPRGHRFNC